MDSPLIKLILVKIPADDALGVQLACEPLHVLIMERFEHSGGVKTCVQGVVSSVARFEWIRGLGSRRWAEPAVVAHRVELADVQYTIAAAGGLKVLKHVREQGCEWDGETCSGAGGSHLEVLKWARASGCEWHHGRP